MDAAPHQMELAKRLELTELSYILSLTRRRFVKGGRDCISHYAQAALALNLKG